MSQPSPPAQLSILLVEDSQELRELFAIILKSAGHNVQAVADGRAAVACLANGSSAYDLVVTDRTMPGGVSGEEVVRAAKARGAKAILMSGDSIREVRLSGAQAGADAVLEKPLDSDQFLEAISGLFR